MVVNWHSATLRGPPIGLALVKKAPANLEIRALLCGCFLLRKAASLQSEFRHKMFFELRIRIFLPEMLGYFTKILEPVFSSVIISVMCKWTRPFWGTDCQRPPKASFRPRQPCFAAPALRELESACRVSIFWDAVTVPTVCFSKALRVTREGQQQPPTQTLCIHLLGID